MNEDEPDDETAEFDDDQRQVNPYPVTTLHPQPFNSHIEWISELVTYLRKAAWTIQGTGTVYNKSPDLFEVKLAEIKMLAIVVKNEITSIMNAIDKAAERLEQVDFDCD